MTRIGSVFAESTPSDRPNDGSSRDKGLMNWRHADNSCQVTDMPESAEVGRRGEYANVAMSIPTASLATGDADRKNAPAEGTCSSVKVSQAWAAKVQPKSLSMAPSFSAGLQFHRRDEWSLIRGQMVSPFCSQFCHAVLSVFTVVQALEVTAEG